MKSTFAQLQSIAFTHSGTVPHLTTIKELRDHIQSLAKVPVSDTPFISCYLKVDPKESPWSVELEKQSVQLKKLLSGKALQDFEESLTEIKQWLSKHLQPKAKSVAIFVRGHHGGKFWVAMQFAAPLPNLITIHPTPSLYHLIELKDNYHSYVLLIAKKNYAYILEVNLGEATIQSWLENPDLYKHISTEWSKLHFQVHKEDRGTEFHKQKTKILRKLMAQNELSHLVIAGDPEVINSFKHYLPLDLRKKCVDIIPIFESDQPLDIVNATLSSFIDYEEQESQHIADKLVEELYGQNLAVAGTADTFDALLWGEVDTLVISSQYDPAPGWRCHSCKKVGFNALENSDECPYCQHQELQSVNMKEAILRLASQQDILIEVVGHSDLLLSVGGVGCLLRQHMDI